MNESGGRSIRCMTLNPSNFILTDDIRKASVILGLKPHLKQNFRLNNLSKQIVLLD